jgi:GTP cyclohydrolase I
MSPYDKTVLQNLTVLPGSGGVHASDRQPSRAEAEEAVRTLIRWAGDDPSREGLLDTPARVARSYKELFVGYTQDPDDILSTTFAETENYDDMVLLKDIKFESTCEHHMLPVIGTAHVAYVPQDRVVGISKLARVVHLFGKRLQIQEKMTSQIAQAIEHALAPKGVAVVVDAVHECMTNRGVHTHGSSLVTRSFSGVFQEDHALRRDFMDAIGGGR